MPRIDFETCEEGGDCDVCPIANECQFEDEFSGLNAESQQERNEI